MKSFRLILPTMLFLTLFACQKEEQAVLHIYGTYQGLLYRSTYVTYTGTYSRDTLDANYSMEISEAGDQILLNCEDSEWNDLKLSPLTDLSPNSIHYGNEQVFLKDWDSENSWTLYMYFNKSQDGKDSLFIHALLPPGGGWSSSTYFKGVK